MTTTMAVSDTLTRSITGARRLAAVGLAAATALAAGIPASPAYADACVSGQAYTSYTSCTMPAGVTTVTVHAWGGGGGTRYDTKEGYAYGGGGGGSFCGATVSVTSGATLTLDVGAGGCDEDNGGDTVVTGHNNSGNLKANGGKGVYNDSGKGGGSTYYCTISATAPYSTIMYSGGSGGNASSPNGGGGGGAAASPSGDGASGANGSATAGGAGGAGGASSGAGGNGGNPDGSGVQDGFAPGGGAGGNTIPSSFPAGASRCGGGGQVRLYWGYTIGGTVTGLTGSGLVLENNGEELPVSASPFTFTLPATSYSVSVKTQPSGQTCTVGNGSGTATANVTNVAVNCVNNPDPVTAVPTLSDWAQYTMMLLLLGFGVWRLRRMPRG